MKDEIKWSMTFNGVKDPVDHRMVAALTGAAINGVPIAYLEFVARDKKLDLGDFVGTQMGFSVWDENGKEQSFNGTCISAEAKGSNAGDGHYVVEIRPWLWFLSRTKGNRIFQNKKTSEIVKDILGEYGFSGDLKTEQTKTEAAREYCVQYRETDLNFIKRLMEEEGFYFYFEYENNTAKMIMADQPSTHGSAGEDDKYLYSDEKHGGAREQIIEWKAVEKAVTGKVTLRDYDFTKPSADLTASADIKSGSHGFNGFESYQYPGGYTDVAEGDARADALIEEHASGHKFWTAVGTMINLHAGKIFEIVDHPRHESAADNGFMSTRAAQLLDLSALTVQGGSALVREALYWRDLGKAMTEHLGKDAPAHLPAPGFAEGVEEGIFSGFYTVFDAVLKSLPFRGARITPKPEIAGVQTAVVTGASGDEISVDKYGRIKVQFHWDREGKKDDKTTCWVRTMMPWTGKNWGMVGLPRIGQEVVIQFEEGDPDRPLCIGMLYNADTMPPYTLPADATRTGIKTNSSKGGGGYNELMFEDKKGEELVRYMAEKDYVQNVQNMAHIKVGYPHEDDVRVAKAQDDKSMKLEVKNHLDEIVEEGDHSFIVKAGAQVIEIEKDKTEKNNKNSTTTIEDDYDRTITSGNMSTTVKSGNQTTKVSQGNIKVDASAGTIDITAAQSITLKCGGSTIKLEPAAITIKSVMVKVEGSASLNASAPMTEVKASGMLILNGTMTKIN